MDELLPPWPLLTAFIAASLALAVTPGPGVLYIVTRSLMHGRRAGLASVAGVALGNLGNATAAVLGLAALFAVSSTAFAIVRYAGAAYLVFLGIKALRSAPARPVQGRRPPGTQRAFYDGLLVALLNPKTTIFFAAFLPQFMGLDASPVVQGLGLGALFVAIAAMTDSVYALASGAVAPLVLRTRGVRTAGRYLSGGTFIGLGLFTAFAGGRVSD
jgi:threonine/homoserine/homoserine lactone efflux protein